MSTNAKAENKNMLSAKAAGGKITFSKAVFIYMLGGLVGTLWETVLNLVCGNGFVFCNGSLFTPFNFVYGAGALFIIASLHGLTEIWQVYIAGALGGGLIEYVLSFLEEKLLGTRSWDYSGRFLNINGRTTLIYMLGWGLLCTAVIFIVYKPLDKALGKIPAKVMKITAIVMTVILVLDLSLTIGAILRYAGRNAGRAALTPVGELFDRLCNDAFMRIRFPRMRFA